MTRFGVPDGDMPDSLPPPGWGPAPFDERDLDAVLAGKTADVPVALRPVADALAALRAGPVAAELYGEVSLEFPSQGVHCIMDMALDRVDALDRCNRGVGCATA